MTEANEPPAVPICPFPLDPSANVSDLVDSATKRLDDLRSVEQQANQRSHKSVRREVHAEAKALRREAKMRVKYQDKLSVANENLRIAESKRLDSIRSVDVAAAAADRLVQETRATTLATAQNASAEALRGQVATTAAAQTIALDNKIAPVQKDVSDLREVQYKQQGERAQAIESRGDTRDAAAEMKPIIDAIEKLTLAQALTAGGKAQVVESRAKQSSLGLWLGLGVAAVVGFNGLVLTLVGIVVTIVIFKKP